MISSISPVFSSKSTPPLPQSDAYSLCHIPLSCLFSLSLSLSFSLFLLLALSLSLYLHDGLSAIHPELRLSFNSHKREHTCTYLHPPRLLSLAAKSSVSFNLPPLLSPLLSPVLPFHHSPHVSFPSPSHRSSPLLTSPSPSLPLLSLHLSRLLRSPPILCCRAGHLYPS